MGMVEEAFRIAVRGVQFNPNFGGGRIALAKVFLDRDNLPGAIDELEKAVDLSPDNILAHSLLGDCYLQSQHPKEALRAFKMVLFLAPTNEKANRAVRKLESLTADEYDDDVFQMKPLPQIEQLQTETLKPMASHSPRDLERLLSLSDAFIVRGDIEKAESVLNEAIRTFGRLPEVVKRVKLVSQRVQERDESDVIDEPPPSRQRESLDRKIDYLRRLLAKVQHTKTEFT